MEPVETLAALEALYGTPKPPAHVKVADRITAEYRAWIEAAPFCALATAGPEGLDCSPRGDRGAVVSVLDDRTLALPDRRGNDRIDSLRNILRDPRVALMFLVPGSDTVIRVNGRARIVAGADFLARFAVEGKPPRAVVLVEVAEVYFQCARAVMRAGLWNGEDRGAGLPSAGAILQAQTSGGIEGRRYDEEWPARAAGSMW